MPNINEMLLKIEGIQYATALDLNMGYYSIRLIKNASSLYNIMILWRNIFTSVYQWELRTHKKFSNRK